MRNSDKRCPRSIKCDLEYLLLLAGHFSIPSDNVYRLHICSAHYHHLLKTPSIPNTHCELCKVLRNKSTFCRNPSSLRQLSKPSAVALWHNRKIAYYQRWICTDCRHFIERKYVTNDTMQLTDQLYQRLYDDSDDIVFPPEPSPMSTPSSEYLPSFDNTASTEIFHMADALKRLLREQHFNHRIETTSSYHDMNNKSQRTFRNQTKEILLHVTKLLAASDYKDVFNDIVNDEINKNYSIENR